MKNNKKFRHLDGSFKCILMDYTKDIITASNIVSEMNHKENEEKWDGHEKHIYIPKSKASKRASIKKIGESILNYQEVVLFGPTDAGKELKKPY